MTRRCADLDEFFDGELAAVQADAFRDHLATCERCQRVLDGRMQEGVAVRAPAERPVRAPAPAPARIAVTSGDPPTMTQVRAPGEPPRRRWVRALTYAVPLVATAAAIPLCLIPGSDRDLELSVAIARAPVADSNWADRHRADIIRGSTARPGGTLRSSAHGARHRAIGVYLEERLIAACPGDARCSDDGGDLALALPLTDLGRYTILALGSSDPLPALRPTLDQTRATARRAGIRTELQYVDVE
jgi:hypothetical protein